MEKFRLTWENNADTPITASSLSKFISHYSEDLMLYVDNDDFSSAPDNKLKLRANSKISINEQITSAYFNFNNTYTSHNSRLAVIENENTTFRIDSDSEDETSTSLAVENGTTNLFTNPSFENGISGWEVVTTGTSTQSIAFETPHPNIGNNSVQFNVDAAGSLVQLKQTVQFPSASIVSTSFYYKTTNTIKALIVGNPGQGAISEVYWGLVGGSYQWNSTQTLAEITLGNTNGKWRRFEMPSVSSLGLNVTEIIDTVDQSEIQLYIYSATPGCEFKVDGCQFEINTYNTSYTDGTRNDSKLTLDKKLIDISQGLIDIKFKIKSFSNQNNVLLMDTSTVNDVMRIYFDEPTNQLSFLMYDDENPSVPISTNIIFDSINEIKDLWIHLIASWHYENGLKLYIRYVKNNVPIFDSSINNTPFIPYPNISQINKIHIGGDFDVASQFLLRGIIDDFKINYFEKSDNEITTDLLNAIEPDEVNYKLFENNNHSITLDESYLDAGTEFQPNSEYYVWVSYQDKFEEEADILISLQSNRPYNRDERFSTIIGGFSTDASSQAVVNSLWDKSTFFTNTIHTNRLLINGKKSYPNGGGTAIEFSTEPWGLSDDITINTTTRYNGDTYFQTSGVEFMHVNPSGFVDVDNVRIDGNEITSINNTNLSITSNSGRDVHINPDVNVNIDSGSGSIHLDDIRVKGARLYTKPDTHLYINADQSSRNIEINSNNGIIFNKGSRFDIDSLNLNVNSNSININSTSLNANLNQINITATATNIDDVIINNNSISTNVATSNLRLQSGSGQIQISDDMTFDGDEALWFGSTTRQNINLYSTTYGIGVQSNTQYFRSAKNFAWFSGGTHHDGVGNAGGGTGKLLAFISGDGTQLGSGALSSVSVDTQSRFYAGKVHNAVWNDLAECWEVDKNYPFDYEMVMTQTEQGIRYSTKRAEFATVGITSKTYGLLLGDEGYIEDDFKNTIKMPIAISGRVKVTIYSRRKPKIGQELVSYPIGRATVANFFERVFKRDRIIGKIDKILSYSVKDKEYKCWVKVK